MKVWLDTDDPNTTHYMWECPDQHVLCLTCGDKYCDECGYEGPTGNMDYAELTERKD